jgi:hypothetical protein
MLVANATRRQAMHPKVEWAVPVRKRSARNSTGRDRHMQVPKPTDPPPLCGTQVST